MKKIGSVVITLVLAMVMITGCGAKALSEDFNDEEVKKAAKNAITTLDSGDYETFSNELVSEIMKEDLTADVLKNAVNQVMPDRGAFVEFSSEATFGKTDKNEEDYAVVVVVAKYESQKVTYTISLDKDLKIIGFYLK